MFLQGSGCGSVGRAVASDSKGPRSESHHRQNIYIEHFTVNCIEKTKIKKKRPGRAHFFKKKHQFLQGSTFKSTALSMSPLVVLGTDSIMCHLPFKMMESINQSMYLLFLKVWKFHFSSVRSLSSRTSTRHGLREFLRGTANAAMTNFLFWIFVYMLKKKNCDGATKAHRTC